jgi:N-acyl-D-amino-acid deacylase
MRFDVIVRNVAILDGTGRSAVLGHIGIRDGRLAAVGESIASDATAVEVVDAAGLTAAPGFIDIHNHGDLGVVSDPGCVSALGQGITTQLLGLCGYSAAPLSDSTAGSVRVEEPLGFPGIDITWRGIGGYREALAAAGPGTNVATLVGHNTVRRLVVGAAARPATGDEVRRMADLVSTAMEEGAVGFSSGLTYAPGMYGDRAELTALAGAAARHGGAYHTHMRYGDLGVLGSIDDAIATAEAAGARVNISHLYPSPQDPSDQPERIGERIGAARARGIDVTFDMTLFRRGCGPWNQNLPQWALDGGTAALADGLRDPATRAKIRAFVAGAERTASPTKWDDDYVVHVTQPVAERYVGRSLSEIAREAGVEPLDAALDLLIEDPQFWEGATYKRQPDLDGMLRNPLCVPITDGLCSHPLRHRAVGLMQTTFGAFGLLLGDYVRERGVLSLEEAVHRLTGLAAERLGLRDRGLLVTGMAADLVLFDPATIANLATLHEPWLPPAGINRVMVNGRWAWRDGVPTGVRAGVVV